MAQGPQGLEINATRPVSKGDWKDIRQYFVFFTLQAIRYPFPKDNSPFLAVIFSIRTWNKWDESGTNRYKRLLAQYGWNGVDNKMFMYFFNMQFSKSLSKVNSISKICTYT